MGVCIFWKIRTKYISKYEALQKLSVYTPVPGRYVCREKGVRDFPTIEFNQFKGFYYLNPSSWTLFECRVAKNNLDELSFTFTFDEWLKYKKWHKQIEKEKEEKLKRAKEQEAIRSKNETTQLILEAVQKDIDRIREESEKNINEAADLIKGVKL